MGISLSDFFGKIKNAVNTAIDDSKNAKKSLVELSSTDDKISLTLTKEGESLPFDNKSKKEVETAVIKTLKKPLLKWVLENQDRLTNGLKVSDKRSDKNFNLLYPNGYSCVFFDVNNTTRSQGYLKLNIKATAYNVSTKMTEKAIACGFDTQNRGSSGIYHGYSFSDDLNIIEKKLIELGIMRPLTETETVIDTTKG